MQTKLPFSHTEPIKEKMAQEIETIGRVIKEHAGEITTPAMAVVRVLNGITPEQWLQIKSENGLYDWLGIPLHDEHSNTVDNLLGHINNLIYLRDHDPLTGVGNRRLFDTTLEKEVERALRTDSDLSLIILDIDNFKQVNDAYGHATGDVVLKQLGKILMEMARGYDTTARFGGEEFAIILPSVSCEAAEVVANRILETFYAEEFQHENETFRVAFSAGVASVKTICPPVTATNMVEYVDKLLYLAKRKGKHQVCSALNEPPQKITSL